MTTGERKPITFKRKKLLTRPQVKMKAGDSIYLRIEQPMFIGTNIKARKGKEGDEKKEPPTVIWGVDLQTGEQVQMLANAVLKSILEEEYKENSYVGKCFLIEKKEKEPGRDYFAFHVEEVEDPNDASSQEQAGGSVASSGGKKK